jgi:hypothetical protein
MMNVKAIKRNLITVSTRSITYMLQNMHIKMTATEV